MWLTKSRHVHGDREEDDASIRRQALLGLRARYHDTHVQKVDGCVASQLGREAVAQRLPFEGVREDQGLLHT